MNYCQFRNDVIKRMANAGGATPILPAEYQQVEWIGAREFDHIDTGIALVSNFERLELKIEPINNASNRRYFGYWAGGGKCSILGYHNAGPGPLDQIYIGSLEFTAAATQTNTIYTIDLTADNGHLTGEYCGVTIDRLYSGTVATAVNERIFSANGMGCYANVYYYRLYTAEGLARDMVPCYRKSDGKNGMYDIVTQSFFTDAGPYNMQFEQGPNV